MVGGKGEVEKGKKKKGKRKREEGLRFVLRDAGRADEEAIKSAGAGSVMKASDNVWHVIAGEHAPAIASAIKLNLNAVSK